MQKTLLAALAIAALAVGLRYWSSRPARVESLRESRPMMGTLWTVEVLTHGRDAEARTSLNAAFAEAARIETVMSEWRPDSPVSALNAAAGGKPVEVPDELRALLERAIAYGEKSGGAFDITWRGMGRIWRFDDQFRVPSPREIDEARSRVNFRDLHLDGNRASLARAGMAVGLGGIAKGYAVDRVAAVLREAGFPDFMVAGAGDILASGTRNGAPWRIGIQDPRGERGSMLGAIDVSNGAVSTSGDYERFKLVDGVRYHHIIDPRTGRPARASISVSVRAPSSEQADVLGTALFIMGPEKALALAKAEGVDVLIIDAEGRRHATGVFSSLP